MGRPTIFTSEIASELCARIAGGDSLRTISKDEEMPGERTVYRWLTSDEAFRQQYAQAREAQTVAMAEEIMDIADDGSNDWMEHHHGDYEGWRQNGEALARSRLRVDTRKWLLSKMAPKKYGERVETAISGSLDMSVSFNINPVRASNA